MNILVVDDQRSARRVLSGMLRALPEVTIAEASDLESGRALIAEAPFDVAFLDLRLTPDPTNRDGLVLLEELRESTPTRAVMVTAYNDMAEVRAAMRAGAYDYVLKEDLCEEILGALVEDVRARASLESEVLTLRARAHGGLARFGYVGASEPVRRLHGLVERVALSDRPALVVGPSGSGKELVVRAIHSMGPNPEAPFFAINCGAMPENLVEDLLFGHERGAFTGADRDAPGYLSAVERGTLFLDEIAELAPTLQAKLLRVLETRRFRRLGSVEETKFEGRVVAATHADLAARVHESRFREDLFHRLDVLRIRVPALDERREDIPLLLAHFASEQSRRIRFHESALSALKNRSWPGNVRQLRNLVDRITVFSDDEIITEASLRSLEEPTAPAQDPLREAARSLLASSIEDKLEAMESALIREALELSDGNKSAAARLLGVHRKVVERRLQRDGES